MIKKTLIFSYLIFLSLCIAQAEGKKDITVLQWNIWQEGTVVPGGYEAIVEEIVRLQPDFVTFSEVRNYNGRLFDKHLTEDLRNRGLKYYSFCSYDTGLLSKYPIKDSLVVYPWSATKDCGSIHKLTTEVNGQELAVYTAHLDYRNRSYYNIKGYDGYNWKAINPLTSIEEILRLNVASQRDDAIQLFLTEAKKDLQEGRCVIIGGDFNEPSHLDWTEEMSHFYDHQGLVIPWTVSVLMEKAGFKDAYRILHPNPQTHPGFTFPSDNPQIAPEKLTWAPLADERDRIDFIYYQGNGIQLIECCIFGPSSSIVRCQREEENTNEKFLLPLGTWPTDHKGLWMKFKLTTQNEGN